MPADPNRVQAVFLAVVEDQDPADRAAVLDRECSADMELRRRVEALLLAHDRQFVGPADQAPTTFAKPGDEGAEGATAEPSADFTLDHTPTPRGEPAAHWTETGGGPAPPPITEGPGALIGPYKLLQKIGEGGMGAVYMAEQEQPVRRRVALKIIKPGMDSAQVIARFEAERQALAMMDHQNIARVLDAGTTSSGRPYFVMELVQGRPHHPVLRRRPAHPARAARTVRLGLPRDPARASEGDHPPRHQALECARDALRREAGPKGHRLRHRQGNRQAAHRADDVHRSTGRSSARSNT